MAQIEIDGRLLEVQDGSTIIDAADALGIYIPRFCYHKKLSVAANCRMCLVQVEKAAKPLPACATPVSDGMKISTASDTAKRAQRGVMEFLLINHPLDCPICDQGGECELQDLAVGYGGASSRYAEEKRVVVNKNLGPLIATDMTRCIHCTRCVRFGQEIASVMELGMAGRGEHAEIMSFVSRSVDSELSGNVIDLCPVGALTSKPFRYTARTWELTRRASVSPHCGLGSNLIVQVKQNKVMRVLPRENEAINECWLSDKDRFSYEGLNSEERLTRPMIKQGGEWIETDWQAALEYIAHGMKTIKAEHGADAIGALATPHQTLEELYLLQKMMRGLGSGNVDHRLRQCDFRMDTQGATLPWLGLPIAAVSELDSIVVVGSNLRKDHPLLAHRMRQAVGHGASLSLINPIDDDLLCRVAHKAIVAPQEMVLALAGVVKAAADVTGKALDRATEQALSDVQPGDTARAIAESLAQGKSAAIFLGTLAQHHPDYVELRALGIALAQVTGARFGELTEAANSVGGVIAGALPIAGPMHGAGRAGLNALAMLAEPRKAYILLGVEPELDCYDATLAMRAMQHAEMVVSLTAFKQGATDYADVILPIAPFSETSGSFINTEGRVQSFNAVVKPLGDTRPAWKVLRVIANLLDLPGFTFEDADQVKKELLRGENTLPEALFASPMPSVDFNGLKPRETTTQRIGEIPMYQADAIVRRARALQKTKDASAPAASMCGAMLTRLQIADGEVVALRQGEGRATIRAMRDDRLPDHCVRVAGAHASTATLGGLFDDIVVERL